MHAKNTQTTVCSLRNLWKGKKRSLSDQRSVSHIAWKKLPQGKKKNSSLQERCFSLLFSSVSDCSQFISEAKGFAQLAEVWAVWLILRHGAQQEDTKH